MSHVSIELSLSWVAGGRCGKERPRDQEHNAHAVRDPCEPCDEQKVQSTGSSVDLYWSRHSRRRTAMASARGTPSASQAAGNDRVRQVSARDKRQKAMASDTGMPSASRAAGNAPSGQVSGNDWINEMLGFSANVACVGVVVGKALVGTIELGQKIPNLAYFAVAHGGRQMPRPEWAGAAALESPRQWPTSRAPPFAGRRGFSTCHGSGASRILHRGRCEARECS